MPETITWLHISDTHFCKEYHYDSDYEDILNSFFEDLEKMKIQHNLYPDLIFHTGDVALGQIGENGYSLKDQYKEAKEFFESVQKIFPNVPISNIFIVPGNHDVNRNFVVDSQTEWLENRQKDKQNDGSHKVNEMMKNNSQEWKRFMERLNDYKCFLEDNGYHHLLKDSDRLIYSTTRDINGFNVGIAGLNSAWSSCGDEDKAKLWLGTYQLKNARTRLKDAKFTIVISHHPPNWLTEFEDPSLSREIENKFNFYLHGHEHQIWVNNINKHIRIPAGALYDGLKGNHAYNFVRLYPKENRGEVFLRKYNYGWIPNIIGGNKTNKEGIWILENLNLDSKKKEHIRTDNSDITLDSQINKPPSETMDLQLLRSNAHSFKIGAERCLEMRRLPDGKIQSPLLPAVVMLASSVEFYLKFLLAKKEKTYSGHRLLELFKSFDLVTQNDIIKTTKYGKDEFESLLDKHSNVLVEWQNIHVYGKSKSMYVNIEFMKKLAEGLEFIVYRM